MTAEVASLGSQFARALARKDFDGLRQLLHPRIDFRALTPARCWEASDADTVVRDVLQRWFKETDAIESLDVLESEIVVDDLEHVGYRLTVRNADGMFVVDQHAYLEGRDGHIAWLRIMCPGFRPRRTTNPSMAQGTQ